MWHPEDPPAVFIFKFTLLFLSFVTTFKWKKFLTSSLSSVAGVNYQVLIPAWLSCSVRRRPACFFSFSSFFSPREVLSAPGRCSLLKPVWMKYELQCQLNLSQTSFGELMIREQRCVLMCSLSDGGPWRTYYRVLYTCWFLYKHGRERKKKKVDKRIRREKSWT